MLRALYRRIARFLNWVNGSRRFESSTSQAMKEAEQHRRDIEDRSGGGWGGG
jgi:hypothetical protein